MSKIRVSSFLRFQINHSQGRHPRIKTLMCIYLIVVITGLVEDECKELMREMGLSFTTIEL